ncbi:MAG: ribonuclease Z [Proteobacteria bacterium]|nr:ribonuclease Z [Cystobacterineae bacterium]MCL2259387.1 ribonuclease Z [Cystobacterineae bacterium]MCL2314152.1 ribonuclease Z [Pseudomonadota bacterium]
MASNGLSLLRLTFLGTSAAAPTLQRNVSGLMVKADSELFLFDCGEGSQRQMIRYGTGFAVSRVFFTHFHADHYLGIIGFLRTLGMGGRTEAMQLFGPVGAKRILLAALHLGIEKLAFPIDIVELNGDECLPFLGLSVCTVRADHRVPALSFVLKENNRAGRFNLEEALRLGVMPGPDFGRLQQGYAVQNKYGQTVSPTQVIGEKRKGRILAISGDTRPNPLFAQAAADADVLIHEATFSDEEHTRAAQTKHSTAREAGEIAQLAHANRLVLTHLSSRFHMDTSPLVTQAKTGFQNTVEVANDGMQMEIPMCNVGT